MVALAALALVMLSAPQATDATQGVPPEVAQSAGPRGTSGETQDDSVVYAGALAAPGEGRFAGVAIGVAHPRLALGSPVELTALDTGRTIVAMVVATGDIALSPGAGQALGVGARAAVRLRSVVAAPQDLLALRSGQAASPRLDAPPTLLAALRRKLPAAAATSRAADRAPPVRAVRPREPLVRAEPERAAPETARPAPVRPKPPVQPPVKPAPVAPRGGLVVQVAALSSSERAAALAKQLGGRVVALGKLYRVQLGPFGDSASAQRARDGAARRGYGDARILHTD
ncbi:SPOR domain-containing protein [Sphingomonas sp. RB3P16]|uniref:SPOR domain-containing protein n=1 Tax=Parasphingomonas frigoris TaxID=3096163 RepID=UPI002FC6A638